MNIRFREEGTLSRTSRMGAKLNGRSDRHAGKAGLRVDLNAGGVFAQTTQSSKRRGQT